MKRHTLQWFKNRIGKRIYRLTDVHCCKHCQNTYEKGLVISNNTHASYVYAWQNEIGLEYAEKKANQ